jgi:hypothetical protein
MDLAQRLSWRVTADEPPKWGRRTTEEEKEEMQKEKHTPGKKKKRGRSQITFEPSPGRYAGRDRPGTAEEKGKRCGKSYIAKEDECHQDETELKESGQKQPDPPKKPRTKKGVPHGRIPKTAKQPGTPGERYQQEGAPEVVSSPEGGNGLLVSDGYLPDGSDGIYDMTTGNKPHRIYFPRIVDQAAAQFVSSGIADLMKLASHEDYFFRNEPTDQVAAGHPVLPFVELDEWQLSKLASKLPDIGGWLVHSVLVRNDTVMGTQFDNMVLLKNGRPTVLHFGGTLLWTSMGNRRPDGMSPAALPELQNLRSSETNWQAAVVFGPLTDEQVVSSIKKYLVPVKEKDILDLVDSAKFAPDDRAEIGKGLIERKRLLESM